jgi:hypothetical protein
MNMDNEKRKIGGYDPTQSVTLAGVEFILAENAAAEASFLVCECRHDNILIAEYNKVVYFTDYLNAVNEFIHRLSTAQELLQTQRSERIIPAQPLTAADCEPDGLNADISGKVAVIKPEVLSPEFRSAEFQLVLISHGNGAKPNAMGSSVFGKELYSGESVRYQRGNIAGVIAEEHLPDWAKDKLTELRTAKEINEIATDAPAEHKKTKSHSEER